MVIRDALLRARVPTVAFVDRRAISAGALIAPVEDGGRRRITVARLADRRLVPPALRLA